MYDAGGWVLLESAIADLPADLRWLFESGAVTIEQLAALHDALGAISAPDLVAAVRRGTLARSAGLRRSDRRRDRGGAARPCARAFPRIPLGRAVADRRAAARRSCAATPGVDWALPVGSLRRGQDTVGDIEIVAAADDPARAIDELHRARRRRATPASQRPPRLSAGWIACRSACAFRRPPNAGAALLHLTGTHAHVEALRALAARDGVAPGRRTGCSPRTARCALRRREEDIYAALGLPFIPPEIRNGDEEIEAAARGALPALVARADIRGDLHMHSTWSDGRDSVEAMVARVPSRSATSTWRSPIIRRTRPPRATSRSTA